MGSVYFPLLAKLTKPKSYERFYRNAEAILQFDARAEASAIRCPVLAIAPGACVALLVISLNLLGDGIRDALDPRLRGEV